ncbi:hypothetical protein HAX54_003630 [Datura stramonium]|uniref:Uncharacterized protein n=1 Tax=Datura stramonium TaxID=4076 RepID=A0ABS8WW22_DATST|nr:hypothetical protein [Datura stramonium]
MTANSKIKTRVALHASTILCVPRVLLLGTLPAIVDANARKEVAPYYSGILVLTSICRCPQSIREVCDVGSDGHKLENHEFPSATELHMTLKTKRSDGGMLKLG